MKQLPSMDEVARHAGVSNATVSRVLNASKPVSDATRERVLASIAALGYRANALGRSLSRGASRLLLVLVPDFSNPYYAEIISGATSQAALHGYALLPINVAGTDSLDSNAIETVYSGLTDGVINMMPFRSDAELAPSLRGVPWVNCSEFMEVSALPYVSIDHRQAACDAVQYLINLGHTSIGLINGNERYLYARQRRQGYEFAVQRAGLQLRPELIRTMGANSYDCGSQAATDLLTVNQPPTAIFAVSDTLAIGAIKTLRKSGMRIPQDIAVIGFDDVPIAQVFEPALTTMAQPMQALGAAAVDMLRAVLAGEKPASRTLPHALVLRDTA